jgi:transcriptional regulator with XRE-family HTH domain
VSAARAIVVLDFCSLRFHMVAASALIRAMANKQTTKHQRLALEPVAATTDTAINGGPQKEIRVGGKLKHARLVKGATLKQVADAAACSESLLSKIENGRAYPSLPTLHRIAVALGTNVAALFGSSGDEDSVVCLPEDRATYVVRGHGIRLERLISYADAHLLQSNIHWIAPGAGLEGEIAHQGEELGYVLEGEIELTVDGRRFRAGVGASFHFRSELPHSYRNLGSKPARVIWVSTPPTF